MAKKVEVFGKGCARCKQTIKIMETAIKELGVDAVVEKVEDINEIVSRGIVATPAIAWMEKSCSPVRYPHWRKQRRF